MEIKKKLVRLIQLSDSEFIDFVHKNPSIIHERDYWNKTLAHYACSRGGQKEKIKFLLEQGAILTHRDDENRTAYDYVHTFELRTFIDHTLIEIEKNKLDLLLVELNEHGKNSEDNTANTIKKIKI